MFRHLTRVVFRRHVASKPETADEQLQAEIEERGRVEARLRESEEQYKAVVDNVADAIAVNEGTDRVFVNQAFLAIHGLEDASQAVGLPVDQFIVPEDRSLVRERTLARQRGQKVPSVYEYRVVRPDGEMRYLETSSVPVTYGGKRAALAVIRDITERKLAEKVLREGNVQLEELNKTLEERVQQRTQELEGANQQLLDAQEQLVRSEKLAVIGELAGGVAHDLRNPLGAISNAVYYLKRKLPESETAPANPRIAQFLGIIEEEVERSNQIISDLMTFARVSNPSPVPIRIEDVIDHTLRNIEIRQSISLTKELPHTLPDVMADGEQLQRVFTNLVLNAQDAMPGEGSLTITALRRNGHLEVAFSDTGQGINDENMPKIFEPLFTTKTKGTGLGLSVCQQIVSKHGGSIGVVSRQGEGSTFTVRFPLDGEELEQGA